MAVEGFEKSLGLDPNDPLVPLALFLGVSTTLWYKFSCCFDNTCVCVCFDFPFVFVFVLFCF